MRKVVQRHALKIENQLAQIASPLVWLFSMAPASVNNAISAFVVALVVLFVFHSGLDDRKHGRASRDAHVPNRVQPVKDYSQIGGIGGGSSG